MMNMKKVLIAACVWIGLAGSVQAQYDPEAKKVLDAMSNRYKKLESFQADIKYSMNNEVEKITEHYTGTVAVSGDKYRLKIAGQEVINDGTTMWTYLEEVNEVNINDYDPESEDITPSKIYNIYQKGYKYSYISDVAKDGKTYQIVDLVPEDKGGQFFKIRLEIEKGTSTLHSWQMYDRNGNIYEYLVTDFKTNPKLGADYFTFNEEDYDEPEIVDLR